MTKLHDCGDIFNYLHQAGQTFINIGDNYVDTGTGTHVVMMDASKGHGDIVKCLHRVGAGTYIFNYQEEANLNINNKNDGQTAIMKVAVKVHDNIFHYLHEAGADLNIKSIQFIQ